MKDLQYFYLGIIGWQLVWKTWNYSTVPYNSNIYNAPVVSRRAESEVWAFAGGEGDGKVGLREATWWYIHTYTHTNLDSAKNRENESEAWFNVLLKSGKQQAVANFKGSLFYSVLEMLHNWSLNCPVPGKLLALKMSVCGCEWKMSENWPDVVGGVNLVGVNCPLLTSSLGLHQCLIGCGGLCVNILEGFFCLWSRLQPLCSNVNSVLIAQNVCLKRVTQHAAKCWKNVRESLVIFFPWKLLPRCFAYRRVSAEDLRAMAALDASKLPYGMQERFYQVLHRQYLGLIVWENLSKNWNI